MRKTPVLFFITLLCSLVSVYALDWKTLHEQADKKGLSAAIARAQENSGSIDNLYVLALAYLNLHKDNESGEAFTKTLALDPELIEAKWGLAEVARRRHEVDKSEALLKEVLSADPGFYPAYITLAYIRYVQQDFNEAVRLASIVIKAGRNKVDLSNRTRAYLLRGGTKGMIAHYGGVFSKLINGTAVFSNLKAAENLQPDSAGVKFGLGSFYLLAPALAGGDLVKAEAYLAKAVKIDPLFADAYVRLGQLYKLKNNEGKYRQCLNKALQIDPGNELALDVSEGRCKFICVGQGESS